MTLLRTTMLAGALCCAPAFANDTAGSTETDSGSLSEPAPQALQDVLRLDDAQIDALEKLRFELEDAAFPLYQKLIKQQWELQQAYRSKEPNVAALDMLYRDINQTLGEARELAGKYRAKSLAVLTQRQNFALYNLRMALRLNFAAREAVAQNLIEDPFGVPGLERIVNSDSYGGSITVFNEGR